MLYYAELSSWGVTREDLEDASERGADGLRAYLERVGVESEDDRDEISRRALHIFGHHEEDAQATQALRRRRVA